MATERIESLISKEALAQFDELNAKLGVSITGFEKLVAKAVETNKALGGAKTFKQVIDGAKELEKAEADLAKQKTELQKQQERLNKLYSDEAKRIAELKTQQQARNQQIKEEIQLNQASEGSIKQKQIQIKQLQREYDNLSAAEREAAKGTGLLKSIQNLDKELKDLEGATGRFQRNVGNYQGSAKIIVDALEKARQKFDGLKKSADATPAALERAKSEFEALRSITDNKQFLSFGAKMGDATQEVRTFTRTLVQLETQGLGNSEVANDLRKRLAELTDTIADTRSEVRALASDTRSFDLFASSISFAANVFQTAAGAAAAFGASEEDVAETMKTLLAIENISNGVKGIANELTTKGTAANRLYAFAQNQVTIALDASAAATARLRAAFVTLGIGAIIIGIGLLISYIVKYQSQVTASRKAQEDFNKALAEQNSQAAKEITSLKLLTSVAADTTRPYKDRLQAVKKLREEFKPYFKDLKDEQILNGEVAKSVDAAKKAILERAKARAIEGEISKATEEQLNLFLKRGRIVDNIAEQERNLAAARDRGAKGAAESLKRTLGATLLEIDQQILDSGARIRALLDRVAKEDIKPPSIDDEGQTQKATKKFYDRELKEQADQFKKLSENEDAHRITRLAAREKAFELEKQIIEGHRRVDIFNAQGDADKLLEIEKDFADKKAALVSARELDILTIRQSFIAQQRKIEEEANKMFYEEQEKNKVDLLDAEDRAFQKRQHFIEEGRDILLKSLQEERNAKIEAAQSDAERVAIEQEFANKRKQIELQANLDILNAAIDVAQKKLKLAKDPELIAALEAQLADLKKQLSELNGTTIDFKIDTAQEKVDRLVQKIQGISDKLLTGFQAVGDIVNLNAERDIEAINEEMDALTKRSEREIALTNAEAISKEEKEKKIALIEARTQAQREQLERRQRTIELQRARFEKAVTIGRIIADTAAAVVAALGAKPYTPANIALAAVTGAIGAVQLAKAVATPLPKFAQGTDDAPGGLAWVGDAYRKELVVTPEGKLIETPAVPTVMNVPKHSIVLPDAAQAIRAMSAHVASSTVPTLVDHGRYYKEMTATLGGKLDKLEKTIKHKREVHIHRTRDGWKKITKSGGNETNYLNQNLQG